VATEAERVRHAFVMGDLDGILAEIERLRTEIERLQVALIQMGEEARRLREAHDA